MTAPDLDLLRQFARDRAQDAFAEIVRRHLNLVYSAALRQVRSPQLAEEIAQSVFTDLARDAGKLKPDTVLTAWLYAVTRRTAVDVLRQESRRRLREQIAAELNAMNAPETSWTRIEPLLDEAVAALDDTDRAAVLLRYFENQSLREVGRQLGVSADAAQKRVSRAVERLREFFSKRKITIGAGGLVVLISANAVQSAPAGLAGTISAATLAGATTSISTVIATTTKTIAMTTLQKTIVGATLAAAVGTGMFEARQASRLEDQLHALQQQQAPLTEQIRQLQSNFADATNRLTDLLAENSQLKTNSNQNELLRLRGEIALLLRQAAEQTEQKSKSNVKTEAELTNQSWLERVQLLKQRLESMPAQKNPENSYLTEDDWLQAAKHKLESDADYLAAFADLRARGEGAFLRTAETALRKYLETNNEVFPADLSRLKPYFDIPPADEILTRYQIVPANSLPQNNLSGESGGWLITLKSPDSGALWTLGATGLSGTSTEDADTMAVLAPALKALMDATPTINGRKNVSIQQLPQYLTTPEQKAAYQKLMQRSNSASQ